MSVNRAVFTISGNGQTFPVLLVDAKLRSWLATNGFDASQFNRWRWPVSASRSSYVEVLLTGEAVSALAGNALATDLLTASITTQGGTLSFAGLRALSPIPVCVSSRAVNAGIGVASIYALPLVDARYHAARNHAIEHHNVTDSANRRATQQSAPQSADDIGSALASSAGLTWSVSAGDEVSEPVYDVFSKGESSAVWLDRVLAMTGRVFTLSPSGTASVEAIDRRTVLDVLSPIESLIQAGGVRYRPPGSFSGFAYNAAAIEHWMREEVPAGVLVQFRASEPTGAPTYYGVSATSVATSFGLNPGPNSPSEVRLFDSAIYDATDVGDQAVASVRANLLAEWYYRRWRAGSMRVTLSGVVEPTFGASCQEAIWSIDADGAQTILIAETGWEGYSHLPPRASAVQGSHGVEMARTATGEILLSGGGGGGAGPLLRGVITARSVEPDAEGVVEESDLFYDWTASDGETGTSDVPATRAAQNVKVVPASVGALCTVMLDGDGDHVLWSVQGEKIDFRIC